MPRPATTGSLRRRLRALEQQLLELELGELRREWSTLARLRARLRTLEPHAQCGHLAPLATRSTEGARA